MVEQNFPFDFQDVDSKLAAEQMKHFTGYKGGYVRVGPKGYFMPSEYKKIAADIYNMPLRTSDVFIVTYPRSGTTWTQEMIWLLANDLDYERAASAPIVQRFPFVECSMLFDSESLKDLIEHNKDDQKKLKLLDYMIMPGAGIQAVAQSPRFIKSHLPLSLLPPSLLDTTKVVYLARDPRDVAVSYYNLYKLFKAFDFVGDFETFWEYFVNDMVIWSPLFDHIKEAWAKRHHPNLLFLFYEDLAKDLPANVRRVATFLGKKITDQQLAKLCQHLSIDSFKHNNSVNDTTYKSLGCFTTWEQPFIRKGKAGGWRDHFDAEMTQQAERWMEDNLRDTDLRFPQRDNQ